jgi:hypothetical protein
MMLKAANNPAKVMAAARTPTPKTSNKPHQHSNHGNQAATTFIKRGA